MAGHEHNASRLRLVVGGVLVSAVFSVLMVAACAKIVDVAEFRASLESWIFLPRWTQSMIAIAIPSIELAVCVAWLLGLSRSTCVIAALIMLTLISGAYVAHWLLSGPPECKCFGKILDYSRSLHDARLVVVRNGCLILALASGYSLLYKCNVRMKMSPRSVEHGRSAFTLLETLLVVLLMALLFALLLPSLSSVRSQAKVASDLANLCSHAAAFAMYSGDYDGHFPCFTDPVATVSVIRNENGVLSVDYFGATVTWNFALSQQLYGQTWTHPSFRSPFESSVYGANALFTSYAHTSSILADFQFWNPATRLGPTQWRSTKEDEVWFPSAKGLFISLTPWPSVSPRGNAPSLRVALIDGHAIADRGDNLSQPYPSGEGGWTGSQLNVGVPVMHTMDGLHGRDTRR